MDFTFGRDLSLIWLSLFCLVALLVPIVVLYFAVRFMNTAHQRVTQVLKQGQGHITTVRQQTEQASQTAMQPVLHFRANLTRIGATFSGLGKTPSHPKPTDRSNQRRLD